MSDVVSESKADGVAKGVKDDIDKYLAGVLTKPARPEPDNVCTNPKPKIAAFCSARKLAHQQADLTFEGSKEDATAPFRSALAAWRMALNQYDLSIAQAQADFDQAVAAAVATYEDEINDDSRSREWYLYYTMKLAVVDALQAFQGSTTSADATLAGAAGTLIAAYPAYADAIATAQCQRLVDEATAGQTFWQSVENVLDSTS
ncbi:MAG TPA: hypothetical protein VGB62_08880 [Allosphingosinicella sp.]